MSRLERKCLVASAGAHSAIALLLFVAPLLWVTQRNEITLPVMTILPSRLVDGASGGGGSPTATSPPAPARAQPQPAPLILAPQPAPSAPQKPTPKPETQPAKVDKVVAVETPSKPRTRKGSELVVVDKKTLKDDESDDSVPQGKPAKRKIEPTFVRESGRSTDTSASDAKARAAANARAAAALYASRVKGVIGAIGESMSSGTSIEVPGPGGEAYADYSQWVQETYRRAWSPPNNLADDLATVEATVVIARNGNVESFKITKHSRHPALDNSVDRLKKVQTLQPFPPGAADDRRTFVIVFDLITKKRL